MKNIDLSFVIGISRGKKEVIVDFVNSTMVEIELLLSGIEIELENKIFEKVWQLLGKIRLQSFELLLNFIFLMKNTKIVIADDHKLVRKALNLFLSNIENVTVVGEAENGKEVLDILSKRQVSIVLMDIDMPVLNGVETTRIIKEQYPWTKVIVLSMYTEHSFIKKMVRLGVAGYISKNCCTDELIKAIEVVSQRKKYFSTEVQSFLFKNINDIEEPEKVTKREREIINLIVEGFSSKEIANKLYIDIKTVESHRGNIYKKLKVKNVAELIHFVNNNFLI